MGFLGFLKRKEKEDFKFPSKEELDIPPAPSLAKSAEPQFPSVNDEASIERYEDKAVEYEREELDKRDSLSMKHPFFVKSGLFRAMVDELGVVRSVLKESEEIINRVEDFKGDEDKEFDKWHSQILDIQRKLIYADKTLFG